MTRGDRAGGRTQLERDESCDGCCNCAWPGKVAQPRSPEFGIRKVREFKVPDARSYNSGRARAVTRSPGCRSSREPRGRSLCARCGGLHAATLTSAPPKTPESWILVSLRTYSQRDTSPKSTPATYNCQML